MAPDFHEVPVFASLRIKDPVEITMHEGDKCDDQESPGPVRIREQDSSEAIIGGVDIYR
jgi:hypothetical protein